MIERQMGAWIAAGLTTLIVAGLFLRRSLSFAQPGSRYSLLEKVTIVAMVGVWRRLAQASIVSAFGG